MPYVGNGHALAGVDMRYRRHWPRAGQTTAEYAIITFWLVVGLVAGLEAVRVAILDYYYDVVSMMSLPIP